MIYRSCAFTGHRSMKFPWRYDETAPGCIALKSELETRIIELIKEGITDFLSGMAEGTDMWAALIVLALRKSYPAIKLHCILPCEGQECKWSESAQERYHSILNRADSVVYVSRYYHDGCMLKRNRYLVDHTDVLLAVYNGEWRGGTAATVRYAQKSGKKTLILNPKEFYDL